MSLSDDAFPSLSNAIAVSGGKKKGKVSASTPAFVPMGSKKPALSDLSLDSSEYAAPTVTSPSLSPSSSSFVDLSSKFTNNSGFSQQKSMSVAGQRTVNENGTVRLPVDDLEQEICAKAMANDILIVSGDTGSGKSTRTPTFLAKTKFHTQRPGAKIFITQPRRVAAISLTKRVAGELGDVTASGEPLFQRVGYAVGQDRHFSDENAELVFCTSGWLTLKLTSDPEFAKQISYIIIDEAHERDADMEMLLFICAKVLLVRFRSAIKIVLMSATLNYRAFGHYFPGKIDVVEINMRRFPVQIAHLNSLKNATEFFQTDAEAAALQQVIDNTVESKDKDDPKGSFAAFGFLCKQIWKKLKAGSITTILVFLSGIQEIDFAYDILAKELGSWVEICVLHSSIEEVTQMAVFTPLSAPTIADGKSVRFILSTNIAESSVTIPNVSIVIDFGMQKTMRRTNSGDMMELRAVEISQAAAAQRAGRTGRVCNGTVFRLYTEFCFSMFDKHNRSEIQDTPPSSTILRFFSLKQRSGAKIPELADPLKCIAQLVDPPDSYSVQIAFEKLVELGALSNGKSSQSDITPFGTMLVRLPLSFSHSQFVLFGCQFHQYAAHFAVMAAFLNNSDIWLNPNHKDPNKSQYQKWLRLTTASRQKFTLMHKSDLLAAVEVFRAMLSFDRRRGSQHFTQWINDNGFHYTRIDQFMATACDIISRLAECGFEGCVRAKAAIYGRRFKNAAMDRGIINTILPMGETESKACSLIVGWALAQNTIQTTVSPTLRMTCESMEEERQAFAARLDAEDSDHDDDDDADQDHDDDDEKERAMEIRTKRLLDFNDYLHRRLLSDHQTNETLSASVVLTVNGGPIGKYTADELVRLAFGTIMALYPRAEGATCDLEKLGGRDQHWQSRGTIHLAPENILLAIHVLQQLLNRGSGSLEYAVGSGKNRLQCVVSIHSVRMPDTFSWMRSNSFRVYDYPPRSPLHCIPACQFPVSLSGTKKCFLPDATTRLLAVSPEFTLTGRSLRTSLLSLISNGCRLVFAVVLRFAKKSTLSLKQVSFRDEDGLQNGFKIANESSEEFACNPFESEKDRLLGEQILGPLSEPLVQMLKKWTLEEITDNQRSLRICNLLHTLMNAVLVGK